MTEPWVIAEDDDLVVVSKPAGIGTHRSDDHGQDGMHEFVQARRPDVRLSVLHRLDKATSGVLVFGKTRIANKALAPQFEGGTVDKEYRLLVDHDASRPATLQSDAPLARQGSDAQRPASTTFELIAGGRLDHLAARPHTGRTHQVRRHAADVGMPIVGDVDHGGAPSARVFLHAHRLGFVDPSGAAVRHEVTVPGSFEAAQAGEPDGPRLRSQVAHEARRVLFDDAETDAYLAIDREHDGFPDVRVERLGRVALAVHATDERTDLPTGWVDAWAETLHVDAVFVQRRPQRGANELPEHVTGATATRFVAREAGLDFQIDLTASTTSSGLFLDQRETRRTLRTAGLAGRTVLNAFGHTGSLSVAAAAAGAETLTLDLSRHYLDWARENLSLNGFDPEEHDFIYGDAMEWMARLARKGRRFDVVIVDPPSTSTTRKGSARWTVARDLHALVASSVDLVAPGGALYVSTNLRKMTAAKFLAQVDRGLATAGRPGAVRFQTVPIDHRTGPGDPGYLKGAWVTFDGASEW